MATNCGAYTVVMNSSCLLLYRNNWANINLRSFMEWHVLLSLLWWSKQFLLYLLRITVPLIKFLELLYNVSYCGKTSLCRQQYIISSFSLLDHTSTLRCMYGFSSWHLCHGKDWPPSPLLIDYLWLGTCGFRPVLTNLRKQHFIREAKCNRFSKAAPK